MKTVPHRVRPGNRAFTLIEVLVVVAIIALLVAILLPTLSRVRRQSRQAACGSQLHQIGLALVSYAVSHKEFPHQARVGVPGSNIGAKGGNVIGAWPSSVHNTLGRYLGTRSRISPSEVFYCPSVREADRGAVDIDREEEAGSIGNPEAYLHITYFYYGRLQEGNNDPALPRSGETVVPARRKLYVTREPDALRVLMADAVSLWMGYQRWRVNHGPDYNPYIAGQKPLMDGQNVAYGDGHVEWRAQHRFPSELRTGSTYQDLARSAQLWQLPDLHWW